MSPQQSKTGTRSRSGKGEQAPALLPLPRGRRVARGQHTASALGWDGLHPLLWYTGSPRAPKIHQGQLRWGRKVTLKHSAEITGTLGTSQLKPRSALETKILRKSDFICLFPH